MEDESKTEVLPTTEEADPFPAPAVATELPKIPHCSFCDREAVKVDVLIPNPTNTAAICETCVGECAAMIQREQLRLVRENRQLVAERDAALAKLEKVQELIAAIQK
jgi:hypothetical protein